MIWGIKNVKNFDYCLCSSCRAVSFRFILYLVHELVGMTSHHPFIGLGQNQASNSYFKPRGRFHEASFVFSFLKVKEEGFLTFGKASLKSCFTKPPLFHLTKDFP